MKPFKEVIDGIRKAVMASEVREDLAQMGEYVEQFANTAGENIQKAIDPTLSVSGKAADAAKVGEAVLQVKKDIDYLANETYTQFQINKWEYGTITNFGALEDSKIRIRSELIRATKGSVIIPRKGFVKQVVEYMPDGTFLTAEGLNASTYTIQRDCYIKVVSGYVNDLELSPDDGEKTVICKIMRHPIHALLDNYYADEKRLWNDFDVGYIPLSDTAIGDVVTVNNVIYTPSFKHVVMKVLAGESIALKNILGGTSPRAYAFLDENRKLVMMSDPDKAISYMLLQSNTNGYLIVNTSESLNAYVYRMSRGYIAETKTESLKIDKTNLISDGYIDLSSDRTDFNPKSAAGWAYVKFDVNAGDEITVTGEGGGAAKLYSFVAKTGIIISKAAANEKGTFTLNAPMDCVFIGNFLKATNHAVYVKVNNNATQIAYEEILDKINALEGSTLFKSPLVRFDFDYDMKDVGQIISNIDMSTASKRLTVMEQVYTAMDEVCAQNNGYVTKIDAGDMAGIEYPSYATDYKMYLYKFAESNTAAGNTSGAIKRKLFIIGGVHGDETAAPVNMYILAKRLCEDSLDTNIFKLRAAFDIYMVPCVNGYGLKHGTRVNYNGVNINRNFPTSHWKAFGKPFDADYSGSSAGSEFETKVICKITELIKPDLCIDHHNYSSNLDWQFYTSLTKNKYLHLAYQSLVDCSVAFKRKYPEYFGTTYGLLKNREGDAPQFAASTSSSSDVWWSEQNIFGSTIEISNAINYNNGVYNPNGNDFFGKDTFSVAEYTLRNLIMRFGGYILDHEPIK